MREKLILGFLSIFMAIGLARANDSSVAKCLSLATTDLAIPYMNLDDRLAYTEGLLGRDLSARERDAVRSLFQYEKSMANREYGLKRGEGLPGPGKYNFEQQTVAAAILKEVFKNEDELQLLIYGDKAVTGVNVAKTPRPVGKGLYAHLSRSRLERIQPDVSDYLEIRNNPAYDDAFKAWPGNEDLATKFLFAIERKHPDWSQRTVLSYFKRVAHRCRI